MKDLHALDYIHFISLFKKYINEDDLVQQKDLSLLTISSGLSFNNELENLNLEIAEKNKAIHEQESKLNELGVLVETLMRQILRDKIKEKL